MASQVVSLPWGRESLSLTLPADWQLKGVLEPASPPAVTDVNAEVQRSLEAPIASERLLNLAGADKKIALVIDDDSRPTPVAKMLPPLFAELNRAGVGFGQITIVTALGVHRPMQEEELRQRVGGHWLDGYDGQAPLRWENHNCDEAQGLRFLGTTKRGVPVYLNKTVAEADLVILVGCIEPHTIASFGGGYKNLIPGVAGRQTIAANHALNCQPETFNNAGQPVERNPMRLDLEEGAQMLPQPVFVVNAVLNSALEVVKVVCGHPLEAHRAGAQASAQIYGVQLPCLGDVVITTSHPMDQDLRQGVKALANNIRAVRRGGPMIVRVRAEEGVGVFGLANRKLPVGRSALKLLAPILLPLVPKLSLKGMGEEDKFFLYFALQAMRRCNLLLYAPSIPVELHERLPFVRFVSSLEEAIALTQVQTPAKVLVIPHGGSTYPILPV